MTVTTTTNYKEYQADGIATVYAIPFLLLDRADLSVYLNNQLITTGYTISRIGEPISQITFAEAPNGLLLLQRRVELLRDTDYQENGDLLASTLNKDFDRLYLIMQGFKQNESQSLRVVDAEGVNPIPDKQDRANKFLGFDLQGEPLLVSASSGSALELAQQLANYNGAGLIGFDGALIYPANTAGNALLNANKTIKELTTQLTNANNEIKKLKQWQDKDRFTIIYPNGGTEETPANIEVNKRYIEDNPFPNSPVMCIAEIFLNGDWGNTGWISAGNGMGVKALQLNDSIVIRSGGVAIVSSPEQCGTPLNSTGNITTPAPFRVKVWRVV